MRTTTSTQRAAKDRLTRALFAQGVESQIMRHIGPLMATATRELQRLSAPAATTTSSSSTPQQNLVGAAAAAAVAYEYADGLQRVWSLLTTRCLDQDSSWGDYRGADSAAASLQLALTVMRCYSRDAPWLQQCRVMRVVRGAPKDTFSSAVVSACECMHACLKGTHQLIFESQQPGAAQHAPAAVSPLLLSEYLLPCMAICILGAAAEATGSCCVCSECGGASTSNSVAGSSSGSNNGSNASTTSSNSTSGVEPSQLLSMLQINEHVVALAASCKDIRVDGMAAALPVLQILCWFRDTAASPEELRQVSAAQKQAEAVMLLLLPHYMLRWAAALPPSDPQHARSCLMALTTSDNIVTFWRSLTSLTKDSVSSSGGVAGSSSSSNIATSLEQQQQQQFAAMLAGVLPAMSSLALSASVAAQSTAPGSQPAYFDVFDRLAAMTCGWISFATTLPVSDATARSSTGSGGCVSSSSATAAAATSQAMAVLQQSAATILSMLDGCLRQLAALARNAEAGHTNCRVSDAVLLVAKLTQLQQLGSPHTPLDALLSGAAPDSDSVKRKQLFSLLSTMLKVVHTLDLTAVCSHHTHDCVASCDSVAHCALAVLDAARFAAEKAAASAIFAAAADDEGCPCFFCSLLGNAVASRASGASSTNSSCATPPASTGSGSACAQAEATAAGSDSGTTTGSSNSAQDLRTVSTTASAAPLMPAIVLLGRCLLYLAEQLHHESAGLTQLAAGHAGAPQTTDMALAFTAAVKEQFPASSLVFAGPGHYQAGGTALKVWPEVVIRFVGCCPFFVQLTSAGYDVGSLVQQLAQLLAARDAAASSCTDATLTELVRQLQAAGSGCAALATPIFCNNPACDNLAGPSDVALVSGLSCVCGGCLTARYCSRACQRVHWKQHAHKPVCKALAAAAAAAEGGGQPEKPHV